MRARSFVCLFVCLCCTVDNTAQWAIATTCPAVLLRRSATTQTTREQSVRGSGGGGGRAAVRLGQWDENEHWWLSRCTGMGIGQSHTHTHTHTGTCTIRVPMLRFTAAIICTKWPQYALRYKRHTTNTRQPTDDCTSLWALLYTDSDYAKCQLNMN